MKKKWFSLVFGDKGHLSIIYNYSIKKNKEYHGSWTTFSYRTPHVYDDDSLYRERSYKTLYLIICWLCCLTFLIFPSNHFDMKTWVLWLSPTSYNIYLYNNDIWILVIFYNHSASHFFFFLSLIFHHITNLTNLSNRTIYLFLPRDVN